MCEEAVLQEDIISSDSFVRVRIGVGKKQNENEDLADFVLSRFSKEQIPVLEKAIINAANAVAEVMSHGVESAMNKFNGA